MSVAVVRHVSVLFLHDAGLVARAYADPDGTLARFDLSAEERRWLVAPDRRRWLADALRPRRVLRALLDEFPAASALAVSATHKLATLDAFFAGPEFEHCVFHRGTLHEAFAAFLVRLSTSGTLDEPRLPAVAALESALARVRRAPPPARHLFATDRSWVRSPHVVPVSVASGALAVLHAVQQVLFEITLAPVAALADDGPDLAAVPSLDLAAPPERLLAERADDGSGTLAETTTELADLLEFAAIPRTATALADHARTLGAGTDDELRDLLRGLARDGLLSPAPA